jgi:hypothetical protein
VYFDDLDIYSKRKCIIKNENNYSNFKTIITQEFVGENYFDVKKKEFGDVYYINKDYNKEGKEIKIDIFPPIKRFEKIDYDLKLPLHYF